MAGRTQDSNASRPEQASEAVRAAPGRPGTTPRAAVAGAGFIGATHVAALRRLGIDVAGVVTSSERGAQEKAEELRLARGYSSLDAVLSDSEVDVVHLATPNRHHYRQALLAIEAGKHVVCEKPLALTSSESAELVNRAEAAGVVNAICFNARFYPLCRQAREMVVTGAVGPPRFVTGSYLQDWLLFPDDWNWRLVPEEGGALQAVGDIGSHWLDLVRFVTGRRVEAVMADLHTFVTVRRRPISQAKTFSGNAGGERGAQTEVAMSGDDAAGVLLRFEDGMRGTVAISQVSPGNRNVLKFEVDGTESSVSWSSDRSEELWIGHRDRANEILPRDPALLAPATRGSALYPGGHVEGFPDTFRALFAAIYRDVEAGGPSSSPIYATFADGHEGLLVAEAIARSARESCWIAVDRQAA